MSTFDRIIHAFKNMCQKLLMLPAVIFPNSAVLRWIWALQNTVWFETHSTISNYAHNMIMLTVCDRHHAY